MEQASRPFNPSLTGNVRLLRSQVTRHALYGVLIASSAIVVATLLSGYFQFGEVSLSSIVEVQRKNVVIWFLDLTPFLFAFWGQYVGALIADRTEALVVDQTKELCAHASELEHRVLYETTHDLLTDLPNRFLFHDRLEQAIRRACREKIRTAVLLLDVDHFKDVNDTLGHHSGDRLLKQIASRLIGVVRDSDTLARLGGDEFAFLLPGVETDKDVLAVAGKIQKAVDSPFGLDGLKLDVRVSIGAALAPDHGRDVDTLMQRAEVAMYAAKQEKSGLEIYNEGLDTTSPYRLTLMGELRQAIDTGGLELHFQPKIRRETGLLYGVEALIRWRHERHGMLSPDAFIPLAERSGLIKQLTCWVLKTAFAQLSVWHREGVAIGLAVNVPPPSLLDPEFVDMLTGFLAAAELPPRLFTIEITESLIIRDPARVREILSRLARLGVRISIDDFGTGYSSLGYLRQLSASELKIDKSFVVDMLDDENNAMIVRAIIDLAHNLGLEVVAEGVEGAAVYYRLAELGCDMMQGYHISRPLPPETFSGWYRSSPWAGRMG